MCNPSVTRCNKPVYVLIYTYIVTNTIRCYLKSLNVGEDETKFLAGTLRGERLVSAQFEHPLSFSIAQHKRIRTPIHTHKHRLTGLHRECVF